MDNQQVKDGVGNLFALRMRDVSPTSDTPLMRSMILASRFPLDYGGGGIFCATAKSAIIAAGIPPQAPIYAFQWTATDLLAVLRRIKFCAVAASAFTAGVATLDVFGARPFIDQDTGGQAVNLSGNAAKLRSAMASSLASIQVATNSALTRGTRTMDPIPLSTIMLPVQPGANMPFGGGPEILFDISASDHPLVLGANEGFVITATVPSGGTWSFSLTAEWEEIPVF